jgi:hypothetical protein
MRECLHEPRWRKERKGKERKESAICDYLDKSTTKQ